MQFQPFNFRVIYWKGSTNETDYKSRHLVTIKKEQAETNVAEEYVKYLANHSVPKSMKVEEIKEAIRSDPLLTKVKESLKTGKWDEKDTDLQPLRQCADQLTINESDYIILKNTRVAIPAKLQDKTTRLGHIGYQGIEKTKSSLGEKICYPNMDRK